MEAAIAEARSTAEEARRRWSAASPRERSGWAVKWAAPTAEGTDEHVWVTPVSWSPFRIEGVLSSAPEGDLLCGRVQGQIVGFSTDELSDWVLLLDGRIDGRREGGFTIVVLERHFGPPGGPRSP